MDKVLNQREIDEMVRAARSGAPTNVLTGPVVTPWDIRQAGQIGAEQLRAINQLHELFARNVTTSVGGLLRVAFDCSLVSAEHLTYREFLQRVPQKTYLASCDLAPYGAIAILQLDLEIAFPLIDVLLGGEGKSSELARELSEIEEQVIEAIMRTICRDLQASWQAIHLEFNFGSCQNVSQAHRLMPPEEKNLCLSFEIKMSDTRGTLNLAVPALVSNALLRKISADISYQRPRSPVEARNQIRKRLLDCPFVVELSLPNLVVAIEDLSKLAAGDTLSFPRAANTPATLETGGVSLCSATPVRVNACRAARVLAIEAMKSPGENTKRESS
ncbi:MAG TPA: FliM/FliN family flagellar motor switch protein [Terriglobales bacterium]|nr:FliM/FliN family flagellar motor switch protein [Terriglobales bacterium]